MNKKQTLNSLPGRIWYELEYFIVIAGLLLIWILADKSGHLRAAVMPGPQTVWHTFWSRLLDGTLPAAVGISVVRVLEGYGLSVVLGIALGSLIGLSKHVQRMTDLLIQILRPIPPIAWIPLAILWIGIGEGSKVFLIFLGGFFVILVNVIDGIRYTDDRMLEVAKVCGVSHRRVLTEVVIPGAMPSIFTGLRVGINSCWTCVVAAELVASSSGIGYMISNARNYGQMDVVIVGMLTIGVVGKLMDVALRALEKKVIYWKV